MRLSDILARDNADPWRRKTPWEAAIDSHDPWGRFDELEKPDTAYEPQPTMPHAQKPQRETSVRDAAQAKPAHTTRPDDLGVVAQPSRSETARAPKRLILPPPIRQLPSAWGMEVQRIAHHLAFGHAQAPHTVLFAAPIPQSGVSTLTFLLAHHLASSTPDGRTLLLRLVLEPQPMRHDSLTLAVGDPFSWQQLPSDQALNILTLYGGENYSVAEKVRWYRSLLASARRLYATVVIDTPPFNRCPDSYLLTSETDGVVLVLKSGAVRKPAVAALVKELNGLSIPVLGSVLTFREYPLPRWLIRLL